MAVHAERAAGQGRSVWLRGTRVQFKVESDTAAGSSLTEWDAVPGFDTGAHVHERLEETWYVLSGELEFRVGGETFTAGPGATVFVAPSVPHAFANRSGANATFLLAMSPPGHDHYFDELAEILAVDGPPDPQAIGDLRRRYDTQQIETLTAADAR
jgi:mannose-6-phosphate isomerase-like protein (cupin superfamily)